MDSNMRLISVIEPIQIGDITVMPGGYEKPVTEWTGRWVGESLYAVRCVNPFDHPSHVMVIYRPAVDPQPSPEPEWFDLTPFGEHVLREDIDFVLCYVQLKWEPVSGIAGQTVRDSKEDGYTQFRCLLKDAPPELVAKTSGLAKAKEMVESLPENQRNVLVASAMASRPAENAYGYCPICGAPGFSRERRLNGNDKCTNGHEYPSKDAKVNKPTEDPDEWVTQDRVPYRKGVDEFRWERVNGTFVGPWSNLETNPRMHGYVDGLNDRFQVRCRRRDLPPIPYQKPKTEREVLLYWYDGNVVGRYADCPPTDQSFIPLIVRDGKVFVEIETREVGR